MIGPWPRRYNPFCLFAVHFVGSSHSKILGEKVQFDHFICYLGVQSMSGKYTGGYEEPFSDAMCDVRCADSHCGHARSGHKGLLVQKQGAYKPNKYCMTPLFYVTAFRSMCSGGIGGGGWGTRPSRKSRNGAARPPARIEMPEKRAPKRAQCHAMPDCVALRPVCTAFLGFVPHSLGNGPKKWTQEIRRSAA